MKEYDILSYHPGKQHNLEQAEQLQRKFARFQHATSFYFERKTVNWWQKVAPAFAANLKKRSSELDAGGVNTYPYPEVRLFIKKKLGWNIGWYEYLNRNEAFQKWILRKYAPPKICIGFDTASWIVFEAWKEKSFLVLDLSIAPAQYKLLLAEEYHLSDEATLNQTKEDGILYEVYAKELALADMVLCGSQFVRQSCLALGVDAQKLVVIPYGVDLARFHNGSVGERSNGKVKIAFIGSVNHRKGADVLLKVWEQIIKSVSNAELHFYGNIQMELSHPSNVFYHGFLNQHDLVAELKSAHISVLPTFFEGSSLAVYQSMAMGLAVITTPNAGSIVEHNQNGLLVPYGDTEELCRCLFRLIQDSHLREALALQALQDIKQYTWVNYGKKLAIVLKDKAGVEPRADRSLEFWGNPNQQERSFRNAFR